MMVWSNKHLNNGSFFFFLFFEMVKGKKKKMEKKVGNGLAGVTGFLLFCHSVCCVVYWILYSVICNLYSDQKDGADRCSWAK